ncbi:hypothetical protein [Limisalsivibrio acetivorans]|uniref:hypothetical protein n=1 Tax=Limisalsivibrio acetivorans TaxID=1304888 RepID=UPI0003B348C0|nr:hypothetical protein [Limisalsivibrio acetivorans]
MYKTPISITDFFVVESDFSFNVRSENVGINVDVDYSVISREVNDEIEHGLEVRLVINGDKETGHVKGRIVCAGFFDVDEDLEEDEQKKYLILSGLSIIYGLLRGIVYERLSAFPPDMRLLPAVNIRNLVKEKIESRKKD